MFDTLYCCGTCVFSKYCGEINDFTSSHEITDIKISTCCNSFGSAILYCVIYKEK